MRAFINARATFLISNFRLLISNFLVCILTNMCAYVYPTGRMYLSASSVRVSMLAFVCVHARVREGVCVSPSVASVRLSVCPRACSCVQMFDRTCVRSSIYAFVCVHVRVREGVCVSPADRPSVCLSVRVRFRASKCLIVHAYVHQCMRSCVHIPVRMRTYI